MEENIVDQKYRRRSTEWKAKCESLHDVGQSLSRENFEMKSSCNESVESIANALVDFQRQLVAKERAVNSVDHKDDKILHCLLCGCLFVEPVTLDCGHTLCKTCILPGKTSVKLIDCKECGSTNHGNGITVNVLIADLVRKWFPREYEEEVKKLEEIQRESQGNQEKLVETLSSILKTTPHHVTALKWRSHALFQIGLYRQALEDAELACDLRPFFPSVFHQRGMVLLAMGNYEKAAQSFSRALALEPNESAESRLELLSCLSNILSSESDNPRKKDLLAERFKSFATTEFTTNNGYSKFKAFNDYVAEDSQAELLNELQNRTDTEETGSPLIEPYFLAKRSSQKRPFEDNGGHSSPCARDTKSKCCKVSADGESISSDFSQAAVMRDKEDLECKICYCVLYQPVTTACGHTFCRECLQRTLDHRPECPCCRCTLNCGVERNTKVTEVVKKIVEKLLPVEYAEREKSFSEEKARWKG